jgi:hypothetical protein
VIELQLLAVAILETLVSSYDLTAMNQLEFRRTEPVLYSQPGQSNRHRVTIGPQAHPTLAVHLGASHLGCGKGLGGQWTQSLSFMGPILDDGLSSTGDAPLVVPSAVLEELSIEIVEVLGVGYGNETVTAKTSHTSFDAAFFRSSLQTDSAELGVEQVV